MPSNRSDEEGGAAGASNDEWFGIIAQPIGSIYASDTVKQIYMRQNGQFYLKIDQQTHIRILRPKDHLLAHFDVEQLDPAEIVYLVENSGI